MELITNKKINTVFPYNGRSSGDTYWQYVQLQFRGEFSISLIPGGLPVCDPPSLKNAGRLLFPFITFNDIKNHLYKQIYIDHLVNG